MPLLLTLSPLVACGQGEGERLRRAWLRRTLLADNRDALYRSPELTADKFRLMADTPYNYFRGTNAQYIRDLTEPSPGFEATDFTAPGTSQILLVGDPHPENIGTYRPPSGDLTVEYNDFDGSRYGPFHFDVRRLAVGFWIAAFQVDPETYTVERRRAIVDRVLKGYTDEIGQMLEGKGPLRIERGTDWGSIIRELFQDAQTDGATREALTDYTRVVEGDRKMYVGEVEQPVLEGVAEDETREVSGRWAAMLRAGLRDWPETLVDPTRSAASPPRIKGMVQRVGAGVASYPLLRFYVLLEGETEAVDDDLLLEVKELGNPAAIPGLRQAPPRRFAHNGERVVLTQRRLQNDRQADPLLGWMVDDTHAFRVRHRTKYQKGVDVPDITEKLAEGEWQPDALDEYARIAGRLLARTHANARRLDGGDALKAIDRAIGGREAAFRGETTDFAVGYARRVLDDWSHFKQMLDRQGPTLGWDRFGNPKPHADTTL